VGGEKNMLRKVEYSIRKVQGSRKVGFKGSVLGLGDEL
jgi:hypothetical protein